MDRSSFGVVYHNGPSLQVGLQSFMSLPRCRDITGMVNSAGKRGKKRQSNSNMDYPRTVGT
jgi:hypothetical protein